MGNWLSTAETSHRNDHNYLIGKSFIKFIASNILEVVSHQTFSGKIKMKKKLELITEALRVFNPRRERILSIIYDAREDSKRHWYYSGISTLKCFIRGGLIGAGAGYLVYGERGAKFGAITGMTMDVVQNGFRALVLCSKKIWNPRDFESYIKRNLK